MNAGCKADFGWALSQLRCGQKVARKGWNGTNMFLFLGMPRVEVNHMSRPRPHGPGLQQDMETTRAGDAAKVFDVPYSGPVLCMRTAQANIVVGWLASQTDMLSEDWMVVD